MTGLKQRPGERPDTGVRRTGRSKNKRSNENNETPGTDGHLKGETETMNINASQIEINEELLDRVTGGTVNKNPNPKNTTSVMDQTINGKNYDALAQMIADWLNGDDVRTRKIDNNQDIYDCII